jgi:hypothetical protein
MALRPSQIRASAAESALMIPDAFHFEDRYADLKMPVVIIAGEDDRLIDIDKQSARLHADVSQKQVSSRLRKRPHDPADGDGSGNGSDNGSSGPFVKLKRQIGTELRPRKLISIFARDRHHLTGPENGQRTRSIAIKQFAARRPCGRADHHQALSSHFNAESLGQTHRSRCRVCRERPPVDVRS